MDSDALADVPTSPQEHEQAQPSESAFTTTQWQPQDTTTALQPNNLPIPRTQRAWDRKPLSPFSRQHSRVGKVWKRGNPASSRYALEGAIANGRAAKRVKRTSCNGDMKPVKKLRVENGFGMGAKVARWEVEGAESPLRKIVTRSGRGDLIALAEDEDARGAEEWEVQDDANATVEIFAEDGTIVEAGPEGIEEQEEWEDEQDDEEFNPTMMHLGDIVEAVKQCADQEEATVQRDEPQKNAGPTAEASTSATEADPEGEDVQAIKVLEPEVAEPDEPVVVPSVRGEVTLPDGFVSPVKRRFGAKRALARQALESRRRTLPVQFAPPSVAGSEHGTEQVVTYEVDLENQTPVEETDDAGYEANIDSLNAEKAETIADVPVAMEGEAENEWEDVNEDLQGQPDELDLPMLDTSDNVDEVAPSIESDPSSSATACDGAVEAHSSHDVQATLAQHVSPSKLPSSPVPSVEGQHPRLPLRRSPRRKSTSPVKRSVTQTVTDKPHLVAFTPIKGLQSRSERFASPNLTSYFTDSVAPTGTPLPERSASAPPEEPQMSPQRPARPRLSDDTALLQAFLNRAAESKTSRHMSTSKRESIENRRDSDAVRHALASPVQAQVLGDLDPNSPSPRKIAGTPEKAKDAQYTSQETIETDPSPVPNKRRSGRATRRAASSTATPAAAPNRISIRGNAEGVVLKKSQAQETSQLTRNNTRKNKGGAVLPLQRLSKMQSQGIADTPETSADAEPGTKREGKVKKTLRWNETLVEFSQGGDMAELSALSDEPSVSEQPVEIDEEADIAAPPPPCETPSKPKPKVRRLKAPRTAATANKEAAVGEESKATDVAAEIAAPEQPKAATRRRSRIATPAKGLKSASLLPADLDDPPSAAPPPAPVPASTSTSSYQPTSKRPAPAPPAKKKVQTSKLPAPSMPTPQPPTSTNNVGTTALGQGKENSLISSPPKRKASAPAAGMPTAKNFAPKLDFGKSVSLTPSSSFNMSQSQRQSQDDGALPGLASPAKKAGGRRATVGFAGGWQSEKGEKSSAGIEGREEGVPGLASPAKKRTRRMAY